MFAIADTCAAAYPAVLTGVLVMHGVANPPACAALDEQKTLLENQLRAIFAGLERSHITALPPIQAYDAFYKRFNKTYHVQLQLESLALKHKPLPRAAALVEAMFMAEIKNLLLTAGHDLDALQLPLSLEVAHGEERYTRLGGAEQTLKPGDLYIRDQAGIISSVIYGPDERTQIRPETQNVVFTVYALEGIAEETVLAHLIDLYRYVRLISPEAVTEVAKLYGRDLPK
jgi:DNA/RNA-binding domain of Phe-tRNA-synthetase-like protein